jgi:hypothetical protein
VNKTGQSPTEVPPRSEHEVPGEYAAEYGDDPLIAAFKKNVDRSLLIDNLRRTFDQRARRMNEFLRALDPLPATRTARRRFWGHIFIFDNCGLSHRFAAARPCRAGSAAAPP